MMELGLQKRRSSWCDDEGLVWHPCRSWGGQNGVNLFPQIANFCLCCQLHSLWWFQRCHGNDPGLQCPDIFIDPSLQNLYILTFTFNRSIYCYHPMLLKFFLMFICEYFLLIDGNDLTCCRCAAPLAISSAAFVRSLALTSKDLNSRTRSLIFRPVLRYVSYY